MPLKMKCLLLLLFLPFVSPQSSKGFNPEQPCADYIIGGDSTLCHKIQNFENRIPEYSVLDAVGALKLKNALFPVMSDFWNALLVFDEPLYPIPLGPSVYFFFCIAILFCFYVTKAVHLYYEETRKKLNLHPETAKLPTLPLYWLQQSKREMNLKREVRNTWAWQGKKHLLIPSNPLLDGIDETLNNTRWEDFQTPRDTWSLVNVILRLNELYVEVKDEKDPQSGAQKLSIAKNPGRASKLSQSSRSSAEYVRTSLSRLMSKNSTSGQNEGESNPRESTIYRRKSSRHPKKKSKAGYKIRKSLLKARKRKHSIAARGMDDGPIVIEEVVQKYQQPRASE